MKNELKTLYKKNPKLALQVAKVLGLKIKVKAEAENISFADLPAEIQTTLKRIGWVESKLDFITSSEGSLGSAPLITVQSKKPHGYLTKKDVAVLNKCAFFTTLIAMGPQVINLGFEVSE